MSSYMTPQHGRGKDLCDMLRRELGLPETVRAFSVHFEPGDVVFVRCEYMPKAREGEPLPTIVTKQQPAMTIY